MGTFTGGDFPRVFSLLGSLTVSVFMFGLGFGVQGLGFRV